MSDYPRDVAAARAGVSDESLARLEVTGIIEPSEAGGFSDADVRRAQVFHALERAGLPIEDVAQLVTSGALSLEFIESAGQYVFVPLSDRTFAELSESTGIPIDLLAVMREAIGGMAPGPDDRVGHAELAILPLLEFQDSLGFRSHAIEQALRVYGESLRRMAETESEWFRSEIVQPMLERGLTEDDIGRFAAEVSPQLSMVSDQAVMAIFHGQQQHAWSVNIVAGIAMALERAGLYSIEQSFPAMCFLDITGYTRLTHEQGDRAAAELAERLRRIVERAAMEHDGRAVKWLGDGVMFYFPDPGSGVVAALEMVAAVEAAGMPQAHVGLDAGPVVFQEGDYYGRTVNVAARIGDFARPGEVLVSQAVVDLSAGSEVEFAEVGPVDLKGVSGSMVLHAARQTRA